jgi:hypothetical protein
VYAAFQYKSSASVLVICCVHLKSDPTTELMYAGDLLPRNPKALTDNHITFVLCGDLNTTRCATPDRREQPIMGANRGNWGFALGPPKADFRDFCTNLGPFLTADSKEGNQCYDNFIVPMDRYEKARVHILDFPVGFGDAMVRQARPFYHRVTKCQPSCPINRYGSDQTCLESSAEKRFTGLFRPTDTARLVPPARFISIGVIQAKPVFPCPYAPASRFRPKSMR